MNSTIKNILITGADGQLGREFFNLSKNSNKYLYFFTDKNTLDICCLDQLKKFVKKNKISTIINCAAYTDVEQAESEVSICMEVNSEGPNCLSKISKEHKISLIHISTDFVFDGEKKSPYTESDKANPLSVYGKSKYLGELHIIKNNPPNTIIIRTSWLYSSFGSNFLKTMIRLKNDATTKVVNDQFGSPTSAKSLAEAIIKIVPKLNNRDVRIYHFSNSGKCSWYDFASHIFYLLYKKSQISTLKTHEFIQKAQRPKYAVLCTEKFSNDFGIDIDHWKNELEIIIKQISKNHDRN